MGVPKADRKELATFLTDVVKPGADSSFDRNGPAIEHLCPRCFAPVPGHPETCPHCQSRFKLARTATLRSLIFPGLGDLYLGHRTIAVFEMLGGALAWFSLVVAPLAGVPDENGHVIGTTPSYWGVAFVMLAVIHGIDAAMARHFALKGHHPA